MKKNFYLIILLIGALSIVSCKPGKKHAYNPKGKEQIRINQLGYFPKTAKKVVIVDSKSTAFELQDTTGKTIMAGKLEDKGVWDLSKESVKIADFSSVETPGIYTVYVADLGESFPFKIGNDIYADVFKASIKAYYLQRASMAIEEKYAGKFNHPLAHPDDKCEYHPSSGKTGGTLNSAKGWYDAGDYNKYMVNGGFTVSTMLTYYELMPQTVPDNFTNIPESGNGVSDLLDEIKYELDWMQTMQDKDGGVFFKITNKGFDGFIKPQDCKAVRFVVGKSTTSTLNFVASFAQASRVWKKTDAKLAEQYLEMARKAWTWATKNPKIIFKNPADVSTGEYGHSDFTGDFYWAAAELFVTTGEKEYADFLDKNPAPFVFTSEENWRNYLENLACYALISAESKLADDKKEAIKKSILAEADNQMAKFEKCPYRQPLENFVWGSNSDVLDLAMIFSYGYQISKDKKYLDAAIETTDYIFGKNAIGISFVTGFGSKSTMNPHHRLSGSDGITEPIPGWVVGGPNKRLQDGNGPNGVKYTSTEPARSYMDIQPSYASNEIAINWNAPLVFMTGYLQAIAGGMK